MSISEQQWNHIRKFYNDTSARSVRWSVPYQAFTTINKDGSPYVTPIGSLTLKENKEGYFFQAFTRSIPRNLEKDQRVCVLLLDMSLWFIVKSLILGKCDHPGGVRLMGTAGEKREATLQEIKDFQKKIKYWKVFKAGRLMFEESAFKYIRDVKFHSFEPVQMGAVRAINSI